MVRGIKSGLPISEAIKNAGEEIAGPGRLGDAAR